MQTLSYGNNIIHLNQPPSSKLSINKSWLIISPRQIVLHGMLLTSSFNIQNAHEHLSIAFEIRCYVNSQQVRFAQIFPQKGNIMRGQVKKIRVKFGKQFKPLQSTNIYLKIFVTLNTQFNRQYMKTNRLSGWNEIKDLPIEQYQLPILISDQYKEIKENIRQSILFQSQFGKVSQDLSSLYGQEKFEVKQIEINSRPFLEKNRNQPNFYQIKPNLQRKSLSQSRTNNARSKSNLILNSPKKQIVYFGNEPKISESRFQHDINRMRSSNRHGSLSQKHRSPPRNDKEDFAPKNMKNIAVARNPFTSTEGNQLFQHFSQKKLSARDTEQRRQEINNHQDSSISLLRSLQNRNSSVQPYQFQPQQKNYRAQDYVRHKVQQQQQVFKQFNTVEAHFRDTMNHSNQSAMPHINHRSMELIVISIIAGFFVALGSHIGKMFS